MSNFAIAPDVKCYHAQAAIEKREARKYGLSCDNDKREVRMSTASALSWLDGQEDFANLTDDYQDKVRCAARDLERLINLTDWVCPPQIEVENCDKDLNCGLISIEEVENAECQDSTVVVGTPTGFQIAPSGDTSEDKIYQLQIQAQLNSLKSEIDKKLALLVQQGVTEPTQGNTRVIIADADYKSTDDLVVIDSTFEEVTYSLPQNPVNGTGVVVIASNLDNGANVDGGPNDINGNPGVVAITVVYQPYILRWIEELSTWAVV